jgi:WXG100 family type VII secretion target
MTAERIDTVAFEDAITALEDALQTLGDANASFKAKTDELLTTWKGAGMGAFAAAYKRLTTEMRDNTEAAESMVQTLESIKEAYEDADFDIAESIIAGASAQGSSSGNASNDDDAPWIINGIDYSGL